MRVGKLIPLAVFIIIWIASSWSNLWTARAQAADGSVSSVVSFERLVDAAVESLKTNEIESFVSQLDEDVKGVLPKFDIQSFTLGDGIRSYDPKTLISAGLAYLGREFLANARLMGKLLIIAIISAMLASMSQAFAGADSTSELAHITCNLVIAAISIKTFMTAVGVAGSAIASMSGFMTAIVPVLFTLLVSIGGVASAALMHPLMVMISTGIGRIVELFVFPLLYLFAILGIVSNITGRSQLTKLASLAKDASIATLGISLTFLIGTVSVKGLAGPGLDGAAMRASKFMAKAYLPVVGSLFSDAWDSVAGCSLLIKNAVGAFGLIAVASICLFPVLKLASLVVIYRLTSALIQPIADTRTVALIGDMASSLQVLTAAVAAVGLMFFICLTIVIGLGSATMYAR